MSPRETSRPLPEAGRRISERGDAQRGDAQRGDIHRDDTHRALLHLAVVLAVVAAHCGLAYIPLSTLSSFRIWSPGDGWPILRMFLRSSEGEPADLGGGMSIATGGASDRSGGAGTLEHSVGASLASQLDEADAPPPEAPPEAPPPSAEDPSPPAVRIDPSEYAQLVQAIEDPGGRALRPFYVALEQTARRRPGAITRVAHYGDSTIASDGITMTLRRRLQRRFGDAGHGFILIARGNMPYRHADVHHRASSDWTLNQLVRAGRRDHRYGYGGVLARSRNRVDAEFGTSDKGPVGGRVSRFELFYQVHPRGGRVQVRVDRQPKVELGTREAEVEDRRYVVEVPDGPHRIKVKTLGGGEARLYGMVLEREGPGVVYDSLGLVGARARRLLGIDPGHFRRQHALRQTHLVVLGFGGNDADDVRRTEEQFVRDFRQIIRLARQARPEAGCLLMAPLDQAARGRRGRIETMPQVPIIVAAQRQAARAERCAFFDTYQAMGGENSMRNWHRSRPRLAFGDLRHATPAGYRLIGVMLYKAMLAGFAEYLEQGSGARARR